MVVTVGAAAVVLEVVPELVELPLPLAVMAETELSLANVLVPAMPSADKPLAFWNSISARLVLTPNLPSASPFSR